MLFASTSDPNYAVLTGTTTVNGPACLHGHVSSVALFQVPMWQMSMACKAPSIPRLQKIARQSRTPYQVYIYMRMVGLGNVDHTADARKPVSSATQHALALKAPRQRARHSWAPYRVYLRELLGSATSITPPTQSSPYPRPRRPPLIQKTPINSPTFSGAVSGVSKAMVQLRTVNNTTDATKPVSAATQTGLDLNADNTTTHTKTDVEQHISNLIASAPDALNTLNELALAFCTQP